MVTGDWDAIPTAAPSDDTLAVRAPPSGPAGWEVVEATPEQVTVQIRVGTIRPEDSDGIPVMIESEVSALLTGATAANMSPLDKWDVLNELADLSIRHGNVRGLVETPILLPTGDIVALVTRWRTFVRWFKSLAVLRYEELREELARVRNGRPVYPDRVREGGIDLMRFIESMIPGLEPYEDTSHVLLRFCR